MKRLLIIAAFFTSLVSGYSQELYPVKTPSTSKTFLECLNEYLASATMPTHTHTIGNVTGLQAAIDGKTAIGHSHVRADISNFSHTHVKADVTDFAHTHVKADVTDFAHTHTTADIASGTLADGRIAQSNVTQHQAALTIAQSQVTSLAGDMALKAPLASPTFTGTPAAPSATFGTNTTQIATTAFVQSSLHSYARVTGSNVTTTGQALTDITGLSAALVANSVYEFEAILSGSTTAVTTGIQYGVNFSAAGATIEAQINGSFTSTAAKAERITTLNTATSAFLTTSAQTGAVLIKGIIVVGANAGNLTIKHLKVTSGTSTVFINSYLVVKRIQ